MAMTNKLKLVVIALTILQITLSVALKPNKNSRPFLDRIDDDQDWEKLFLTLPDPQKASEYLKYYTSTPHVAGTPEDLETAKWTLSKFQEFGINNSAIVPFDVLLSYPKQRTVQMVSPSQFTAKLQEDSYSVDPSTSNPKVTPTFNGYSPSGDVTAELVYLNYASFDDFTYLKTMGVNLTGKIGIARYGNLFRGTKAMMAQEHGMAGLLIYSDPANDGYVRGTTFPDGPYRPKSGVQRGSVQFLSLCPGDPQRKVCSNDPNYNWTQGIPAIPVQPLSWGDALPLLQNMGGLKGPDSFQGGLNITYFIGPGPAVVHLKLDVEFKVTTIWNVIGTIPGTESDKTVILGNHRDAWVYGAVDPNSGTASMLEVARSFGLMLQKGWKPRRNIMFASWDGEEYGLLGSTAWVEANAAQVQKQTVAYINLDTAVSGPWLSASATPSLESVFRLATTQIIDPNSGKPLSQVFDPPIRALGSGSDYTAFLDHYGVASIDFSFEGDYGVYHSVYDDYYWMTHFGDPNFLYHKAASQLMGLVALKLAQTDTLPFNYTVYGQRLNDYYGHIVNLLNMKNQTEDLSKLQSAITAFQNAAKTVDKEIFSGKTDGLNDRLLYTERSFLSSVGLPRRPYYKHVIQAPGLYKGYESSVFPGLEQTIQLEDWAGFQTQNQILSNQILEAASLLGGN